MAKKRVGDQLQVKDKVVAAVDLLGVPAGTRGKVSLVNGFRWIRYRVYFDNGADLGSINRSDLVLAKEWTGTSDQTEITQGENS
ncbi:hypothetical protein IMCC26207_11083 [Actinobacteria bacterium IMCC26207]|nr:hypothetical protein IMCC26207_11083 [Actinobacteria bacterium IMCC26207]MCX6523552.1 hypothetical protein [Actinomycetota bacterium]